MHLRSLIQRHVKYTSSTVGRHILLDWDAQHKHFVKVCGCVQGSMWWQGAEGRGRQRRLAHPSPAPHPGLSPCLPAPRPVLPATCQVYPREYRRALDDAAKLRHAQEAEAELLKEVCALVRGGVWGRCWAARRQRWLGWPSGGDLVPLMPPTHPLPHHPPTHPPTQANGVDAFEQLRKLGEAVVKSKPGITNPALAKAGANGNSNGNGNGKGVTPDQVKVRAAVGAVGAGNGQGSDWAAGQVEAGGVATTFQLAPHHCRPPPLPPPSAARLCQAAARRVRGPARGRPQGGVGGGAPHSGA